MNSIVRIPLISGINDSNEELSGIAEIVQRTFAEKGEVSIMPCHKFGLGKYQMLDRKYLLEDLQTQSEEMMLETKQLFESYGLECEIEM